MNKADIVAIIRDNTNCTKKVAGETVDKLFESIASTLSSGNKVQIIGFGSFGVRERAEKKGRNPQTREEIIISAARVPYFKAGKALKDSVK